MPELKTSIDAVGGFSAVGVSAGLKKDGALDMSLIVSEADAVAGGVFTKNRVKAAPVLVNMEHLKTNAHRMRAVAINTVSANAATGQEGLDNSRKMAELVAEKINCDPEQVFVMSTGVIGSHLPMDKIQAGIEKASEKLGSDWASAADGIRTTDSFSKIASVTVNTSAGEYTIAGITKGAGMIAPNMATMLGVLVTDAKLSPELVQSTLSESSNLSYNRIVVDGDTSTNDMVVLLANGNSEVEIRSEDEIATFTATLTQLSTYLAQQVVRDGEGATKFITIDVQGASSTEDAEKIAHTIASSALVKTAFYGNDANWGRIVAAAGRSGVLFDDSCLSLWMAVGEDLPANERGLMLFEKGAKADYDEAEATAIISESSIYVTLDLAVGDAQAIVWTCDFSHEYVSINADYRT
ncbi:MAG: bifunctional glutamate N-acetyltransferase/amino-acid acetyltransferase ArgJ [Phototrophicaceae bacterium]